MSIEESRKLRNQLIAIALKRKNDKLRQRIQHRYEETSKEWSQTVSDYFKTIATLFQLVQMGEQHTRLGTMGRELKEITDLIKNASTMCDEFSKLIKFIVPDSALNVVDFLDVFTNFGHILEEIREMLSSIVLTGNQDEVIEQVQEVKLKMEKISSEMKMIHSQITNCTESILKQTSDSLGMKNDPNDSTNDEMNSFED